MHEYSLFLSLLRELDNHLKDWKKVKVNKVVLLVGTYSGIDRDYLKEVILTYKEGTLIEEAEVILEEDPLKILCFKCGKEGFPQTNSAQCPFCQSFNVEILRGLDLVLKTIEIEDEERF